MGSKLYYKCDEINLNQGRPYGDSPDWIKSKNATISTINKKYNKWKAKKIGGHPEIITKIKFLKSKFR